MLKHSRSLSAIAERPSKLALSVVINTAITCFQKKFWNQVAKRTNPWSDAIPFQQLSVTTHQLSRCNLLRVPTQPWLTELTRAQKSRCAAPSPSQHGVVRLLCSKRQRKAAAVQPCYWNMRKIQTDLNFPFKQKLLLSIRIAKLLLLWLLVVIYQLHSASAADFNNYSSFTIWFHPHFISMLLQHALYMLYIPPACSVFYREMRYPISPRVSLKKVVLSSCLIRSFDTCWLHSATPAFIWSGNLDHLSPSGKEGHNLCKSPLNVKLHY